MKSSLRVTHIIGGGEFGGAEEHLILLLAQLKSEGIQPHVICFYDSLFAQRLREKGIQVDVLSYGRFDFRLYSGLVKILGEKQPDIVHTHGVKANFFGKLAAKRLQLSPIITTVHSLLRYDYVHPVARILATFLDTCTRRLTDQYIAISQTIKDELLQAKIPSEKIAIIHHGIDIAKFSSDKPEQAIELAQEWGKTEQTFLIGAVGRLVQVKGFHTYIEACALLHQHHLGMYRFVLVGDGPEREKLEQLVKERGLNEVFRFVGFRSDIPVCLHALDCYVSSSFSEGLGLAVMEALATGTPVVTTGVGGIVDFAHHEENCLLVEAGQAEALAEAIVRLQADTVLREQLSQQAIADIQREFSVELMGKRTADQYRQWIGVRKDVQ